MDGKMEELIEHLHEFYDAAARQHIIIMGLKLGYPYSEMGSRLDRWPEEISKKCLTEFRMITGSDDEYDGKIGQEIYFRIRTMLLNWFPNKSKS